MNFIGRVMRFLFWLLVVSWGVALLRRMMAWMVPGAMPEQMGQDEAGSAARRGAGNAEDGLAARKLVRDPVCGMHVAQELSIPLREGGELVHFRSMECRDKYAKKAQRKAANA